jgi:hypothetical protein
MATDVVTISWPEAAFWCALSWLVLVARLLSRRMRLGAWRHLQFEDLLAVAVLLCATALMVVLDQVMKFYTIRDPALAVRLRIGAKLMLAGEQIAIAAIWINKAGVRPTFCTRRYRV